VSPGLGPVAASDSVAGPRHRSSYRNSPPAKIVSRKSPQSTVSGFTSGGADLVLQSTCVTHRSRASPTVLRSQTSETILRCSVDAAMRCSSFTRIELDYPVDFDAEHHCGGFWPTLQPGRVAVRQQYPHLQRSSFCFFSLLRMLDQLTPIPLPTHARICPQRAIP